MHIVIIINITVVEIVIHIMKWHGFMVYWLSILIQNINPNSTADSDGESYVQCCDIVIVHIGIIVIKSIVCVTVSVYQCNWYSP